MVAASATDNQEKNSIKDLVAELEDMPLHLDKPLIKDFKIVDSRRRKKKLLSQLTDKIDQFKSDESYS